VLSLRSPSSMVKKSSVSASRVRTAGGGAVWVLTPQPDDGAMMGAATAESADRGRHGLPQLWVWKNSATISPEQFLQRHGSSMKSAVVSICVAGLVFGSLCGSSFGAVVYESATAGSGGSVGDAINKYAFEGIRFQITASTQVNEIGGRFSSSEVFASSSIFGALVSLSSATDVPDSLTLNTPDVLRTGLLYVPPRSNGDVSLDISSITLAPGYYGVVFGSGLFGATGNVQMPYNNTAIGPQSAFYYTNGNTNWASFTPNSTPARFFVASTPEPGVAVVGMSAVALLLRRVRRGR